MNVYNWYRSEKTQGELTPYKGKHVSHRLLSNAKLIRSNEPAHFLFATLFPTVSPNRILSQFPPVPTASACLQCFCSQLQLPPSLLHVKMQLESNKQHK